METDRRAVAAVMKAERALGRRPEQQEHSNPGFDVMSFDSDKGVYYLIEVKGHLPGTEQISVSKNPGGAGSVQSRCVAPSSCVSPQRTPTSNQGSVT